MHARMHTHHPPQIQAYLFHLLSESGEDFIAFSQGALELFKLVHVQRELEDVMEDEHQAAVVQIWTVSATEPPDSLVALTGSPASSLARTSVSTLWHLSAAGKTPFSITPADMPILQRRLEAKLTKSLSLCCFSSTSFIISVILCSLVSTSCCCNSLCLNILSICCQRRNTFPSVC